MAARRHLKSALVVALVLLLPASAPAGIVQVQGLPWHVGGVPPIENVLNGGKAWIEDDSGTYATGIIDDSGPTDVAKGVAYEPGSGRHDLEGAYFGGIVQFKEIRDDFSYDPADYGREVTGAFYGLQFSAIDSEDSHVTVHSKLGEPTNVEIDGTAPDNKYSWRVFFTGGELELWVDDNTDHNGTTDTTYTYGQKFDDGPNHGPEFMDNMDLKNGQLLSGGSTDPDWECAVDSSLYPGKPLLTGSFASVTETYESFHNGNTNYTYTSAIDIVVEVKTDTAGNQTIEYAESVPYSHTLPGGLESLGGALAPFVDQFDAHEDPDVVFTVDGLKLRSNPMPAAYFTELPTGPPAKKWIGDGGDYYFSGDTQAWTDTAEIKDDPEMKVWLTPLPTSVVFLAPAFFGFLGHSLRRKKTKRS